MDGESLRNIFPLGCGTCLCFVRERCHLSVCEMETKYLLLFCCCLLWGLQGLVDENFCVHRTCAVSSVHLPQSCFTLFFFSLFQMRAKPTCSDFFSIVWILSPQKGMWCAPSCSSSHVLLMFSFNFPLLEFRAIIFVVFQVGTGSCFLFAAALAHLSGSSCEHLGVTFCLPPQFTPSVFASIHRTHQTTAVGV